MNSLEKWPVGLKFRPTDAELVDHHLRIKLDGKTPTSLLIPELNIYKFEPWDLFSKFDELSKIPSDGEECFFFCPQQNKNPNSRRFASNRMTEHGYWKDTCKKRTVHDPDTCKEIGIKRIFVYHQGRQRKGCNHKTDIVMHEYHLDPDVPASTISGPMACVLCRIIHRRKKKILSTNQVVQEASMEASPEATIESEIQNSSSNLDAPESSKTQMDQQSRSWSNEDWGIDGSYDDVINIDTPCSPGYGISVMDLDLWNFN